MYGGSLTKVAQKAKSKSTMVEPSSAQIIKQPRKKKKRIRRRRIKSCGSQRQRTKRTSKLKVQGRSCSALRLPLQRQERCCCFKGAIVNFTPEPKVEILPFKGQLNIPGVNAKEKDVPSKRVESSEKRKNVISIRENPRLKQPSAVEKRQYQAVSEYQFIYPGKSVYYCTGKNENQQPGTLSTTNARHKQLIQNPQCQQETKKAQRGKASTDAKCLIGGEFLRSMPLNTLPHGLASLTYKINKLVLVNKKAEAFSGENPASPAEQQPALEKAVPPADVFHGYPARKGGKEGWSGDMGYDPDWFTQGGARNAPTESHACPGSPPKLRPVSAKDCYEGFSLTQLFSSREKWNGETFGEVDTTGIQPGLGASRRAAITHARSAIVIPYISQDSSSEGN
ncbi:uncharacterized protein LOC128406782 [Podarcis raffonei]|uniref:uncharacterized protein LOC128406782 n=1 Tax=Podarcis raffonei TaxID=65483 RepID=UPI00232968DC|nr:uncharacterized protein LOC128406782 [Podarcis raffonei]